MLLKIFKLIFKRTYKLILLFIFSILFYLIIPGPTLLFLMFLSLYYNLKFKQKDNYVSRHANTILTLLFSTTFIFGGGILSDIFFLYLLFSNLKNVRYDVSGNYRNMPFTSQRL